MFLFFLLSCFLANYSTAEEIDPATAKIRATFKEMPKVQNLLKGATTMVLFEGLPHPGWEKKKLEAELLRKETVKQHGFDFYKTPNKVTNEDVKALWKICLNKDSFRPYYGPKVCGGYHPDYSLHWANGKDTVEVQICFGCGEMKAFFNEQLVHCDMTKFSEQSFKRILGKYALQRGK